MDTTTRVTPKANIPEEDLPSTNIPQADILDMDSDDEFTNLPISITPSEDIPPPRSGFPHLSTLALAHGNTNAFVPPGVVFQRRCSNHGNNTNMICSSIRGEHGKISTGGVTMIRTNSCDDGICTSANATGVEDSVEVVKEMHGTNNDEMKHAIYVRPLFGSAATMLLHKVRSGQLEFGK